MLLGEIESHLHDVGLEPEQLDRLGVTSGRPDIEAIIALAEHLQLCARVAFDAKASCELRADGRSLDLLAKMAARALDRVEAEKGGHPDDLAVAQGREAMIRTIQQLAEAKVRA